MYTLNKITTVADCNVLLTWAAKEKADLQHKHYTIDRLTQTFGSSSEEIEAILLGVNIELSANQTVFASLADGSYKIETGKKIKKLEYKKFLLETRKESYGALAFLQKELDLERINKELAEIDVYVAAVTAHRATLPVV